MGNKDDESMERLFDRKLGHLHEKIHVSHKLDEAVTSLKFLSEMYDELNVKVTTLEKREKELVQENQCLRGEINKLAKRVTDNELANDELEQYSRRDCIQICNNPVMKDENANRIVIELADKIGVNIQESDISISHRVPANVSANQIGDTTSFDPAIIVKFARREARESLYKARGKLKDLNTHDMGYTRMKERNIYIIESLTQHRKNIFKSCLKVKRDLHFDYIWTRQGKIFMRFDNDSPAIQIKAEQDLLALRNRFKASSRG